MTNTNGAAVTEPLEPAEHVVPAPDGWAAADVSDVELVDDEFIANDSTSHVLDPEAPLGS